VGFRFQALFAVEAVPCPAGLAARRTIDDLGNAENGAGTSARD
jgi:hypothetical protein